MERWLSGRKRHTANVLYGQPYPGFESLPLRQREGSTARLAFYVGGDHYASSAPTEWGKVNLIIEN